MKEKATKKNREWEKKYNNEKILELSKNFNEGEIQILKKLGITLEKGKKYTEHEFDDMYMELSKFNNDETGLYGSDTMEETSKKFERILNDETHTEREKILINMYYLECAKNIELQKPKEETLKGAKVELEEYNYIMKKFDKIGQRCIR